MPSKEEIKTFAGLLLNGGIFCLTASANPTASVFGALANAVAGNLAANNIATLSNKSYESVLARLEKADPNNINHDLERLFRQSSVIALEFIKNLFLNEVKDDERVTGLSKKERKEFFENLTTFFNENINDLKIATKGKKEALDKKLLNDPAKHLDNIIEQIFKMSSVSFDPTTEEKLKAFYSEKLPYCFQLAFKESLKNDGPGFKAFQIWMLEEMRAGQIAILQGQERIETAIGQLKNGSGFLPAEKRDKALDEWAEKIYSQLEKEFTGIKEKINQLSDDIKRDFEKQYKISEAILDNTAVTVETVKRIEQKIDGKKAPPRHLVYPLPTQPEVFIGREKELEDIKRLLFEGGNFLLLVNGQGGMGKTSVAARYYHDYGNLYKHTAWVLSEKNITNAILLLAPSLNVQFDDPAMPAEQRCDILLGRMAELGKPCLLVIDNANEEEDLRHVYLKLRACPNFHLLLTTRITEFQQAECYQIEGLPEDKALELFKKYYPKHKEGEDSLFKDIWLAADKNTLVTELLAKSLRLQNENEMAYSLGNLLADLQEKGLLAIESTDVETGYQGKGKLRRTDAKEIIAAMYDLQGLCKEEVDLLSIFSVLPAENIAYADLKKLLQPEDKKVFDSTLNMLYKKGWFERNETDGKVYYKISPVVQEIVQKKNEEFLASCLHMITGLINILEYEPTTSSHLINCSYEEAILYCRYSESIVSKSKELHQSLAVLSDRIGSYFTSIGNLERSLFFHENGKEMFENINKIDKSNSESKYGLAVSCSKLGEIQALLGNLKKALHYFELYNEIEKQLNNTYPESNLIKNSLSISYQKLGEVQFSLGNLEAASQYFNEYNKHAIELYNKNPINNRYKNTLANSYEKLGDIEISMGNLNKAFTYYEKEIYLFEELYQNDPGKASFKSCLAISYSKLGKIFFDVDQKETALDYYERFNKLSKELHESYPKNISFKKSLGISYLEMGDTLFYIGNERKALMFYEKFHTIQSQLYEADSKNVYFKKDLAISLSKLGEIQFFLGNIKIAIAHYASSKNLFQELYEDFPETISFKDTLSISYSRLGEAEISIGNFENALKYFKEYCLLKKELSENYPQNISFKNGLAVSYAQMGQLYRNTQDIEKAYSYFKLSEKIWQGLNTNYPQHIEFINNYNWITTMLDEIKNNQ